MTSALRPVSQPLMQANENVSEGYYEFVELLTRLPEHTLRLGQLSIQLMDEENQYIGQHPGVINSTRWPSGSRK